MRMMRTITRLFILTALACSSLFIQAQDIHFSQFYSAPLLLNPAMTGNVSESYRFSFTYRNQWASIPAPYSTVAASFDMSVLGCQLGMDHVGVGAAIFNDRSGDGRLNNLSSMISLAYHKGLDQNRRYMLSAGGQVGFTQKTLSITDLLFESQINENLEFDPTLPNLEPFQSNTLNYVDIRVGGMFTGSPTDNVNFYVGGAYNHLTKPRETFLVEEINVGDFNVLDPRLVFHGGGTFFITDNFNISPSALYQNQGAATEIVFGSAFGFQFDSGNRYRRNSGSESGVYLGAWMRYPPTGADAVIAVLGVDFNNFRFGFSYDINISPLREASLSQGGVELALSFSGRTAECNRSTPTYCPRF